jgi:hypothetical protein
MELKKNIPKFFSKQIYLLGDLVNKLQYDFTTNYFCIFKTENILTIVNKVVYSNKLLKLHDFRYKS